jgi:hypothetical protein
LRDAPSEISDHNVADLAAEGIKSCESLLRQFEAGAGAGNDKLAGGIYIVSSTGIVNRRG